VPEVANFCPRCGSTLRPSDAPATPRPAAASAPAGYAPDATPSPAPAAWQAPATAGPRNTDGAAVVSLVSGILGFIGCFGVGSIVALITGYTARRRIDQRGGQDTGRRLAQAGIVLGWIGLGLAVIVTGFVVVAAVRTREDLQSNPVLRANDPREVVTAYVKARGRGDGKRACSLVTDAGRVELAKGTGSCESAVSRPEEKAAALAKDMDAGNVPTDTSVDINEPVSSVTLHPAGVRAIQFTLELHGRKWLIANP
jgi:hypothetical protein